MMARIASDRRKGWKNGVLFDDTVQVFRARNIDITNRKGERKEHAKLRAESFGHVNLIF